MLVTLLGIFTLFSASQAPKVKYSIFFTPEGIVTLVSDLQ